MRKFSYRRGFCATVRGDERPSVHLRGAAGSGGKERKEKFQRYSFTETHQLEAGQNAGRQLPKSKGIIEYLKEGLKTPFSSEVPHTPSCKPKGCDPGGSIVSNTTKRQPHHHRQPASIIHHHQKSNLILKLLFRECPQKSSLGKSKLIGIKIT